MSEQTNESRKKDRNRRLENVIYEFKHNKQAMFAAIYLCIVILISIFVVFVPNLDPNAIDVTNQLQPPARPTGSVRTIWAGTISPAYFTAGESPWW